MKTSVSIIAQVSVLVLLIAGCGQEKKMEPVQVGQMVEYLDPVIGFSIQYPSGWVANTQVAAARMYNAQGVDQRFLDPTGNAPVGVEIGVDAVKHEDPAARIEEIKKDLVAMNIQIMADEPVTVGEMSGVKVPYVENWGGGTVITGHRVLFPTDTMLYDLRFAGFGGHYEAHAAVFDASLKSFRMPKPKTPGRDDSLPSETFTKYVTDYFSFDYPDNYNFTSPSKGSYDLVVELRGVRQDCSIRFDVFAAEGLDVDKVFEQNKGKYRIATSSKVMVSGQPAWMLTGSASNAVDRRVYFVVKDDKVFRTTFDWYKPQREEYLKAYDQVIGSFRFR